MGACIRPLGRLSGSRCRGPQKQDEERRAKQDVAEEIVEDLVTETNIKREPASA
jgi:hypothetical protein